MANVETAAMIDERPVAPTAPYLWKRHALVTRITHWINVIALTFLLGTGLNIFNAHPSLYWGAYGADDDDSKRWLEIGAMDNAAGQARGITRVGPVKVDTTGVLGISKGANGQPQRDRLSVVADLPEPAAISPRRATGTSSSPGSSS